MKTFNFKTINNKSGSTINLKQKDDDSSEKGDVTPFSTSLSLKPLLNVNTANKDFKIIQDYGMPFLNFFQSSVCNTLPMFTYPPEPKSVKRVILDYSKTINAGDETFIRICPFSRDIYNSFNPQTHGYVSVDLLKDSLACFVKYKIVCAKVLAKQVGIMSLNDGYGTVMDAVMVSPSIDGYYLAENLLNIQTGPGRRIMMVDGRQGLQANFIGSPFFPYRYNDANMLKPDFLIATENVTELVSQFANIKITTPTGGDYTRQDSISPVIMAPNRIYDLNSPLATVNNGFIFAQEDFGDTVFIRISPPSIQVVVKFYIELIVEGEVSKAFQSNMPQIVPPIPFDFNRLFFALNNYIKPLDTCSADYKVSHASLSYCPKPLKHIHQNLFNKKKHKQLVRVIKDKRIRLAGMRFFYNEVHNWHPWSRKSPFRIHSRPRIDEIKDKSMMKAQLDSSCENIKNFVHENEKISYCMQQQKDVFRLKRKLPVKQIANLVQEGNVPDYILSASKFCGVPVTDLKSTEKSNRLFQDNTKPLPAASYAFFPAIEEETGVYPAIICVKPGVYCKQEVNFSVPMASVESDAPLSIYFEKDDFADPNEFVSALNVIVNYLYVYNYHYVPEQGLSIKFFGIGKFKDTSYMMALLAAMYGGPSGGYYTGSFKYDEKTETFPIDEIEEEVLKAKIESATIEYPLMVLLKSSSDAVPSTVINGVIPSYDGGRSLPTNSLFKGSLFSLVPFSIRGIKKTPIAEYNADCRKIIAREMTSFPVKYIALSNVTNPDAARQLMRGDIPYSVFSRSNPDNFTCFIRKGNKIITADDFYNIHSDLLDRGKRFWKLRIDGKLFVEKNGFLADARRLGVSGGIEANYNNIKKMDDENNKMKNIGENHYKGLLSDVLQQIEKGVMGGNPTVKNFDYDLMEADPIISSDLFLKAGEELQPISQMFTDLGTMINKYPATSNSSQPITTNEKLQSFIGQLKLPNLVNKQISPIERPEFLNFKNVFEGMGPGPLLIAAQIVGFVKGHKNKLGMRGVKKTLNIAREFLKNYKPIKVERSEEEQRDVKDEMLSNSRNLFKSLNPLGSAPKENVPKKKTFKEQMFDIDLQTFKKKPGMDFGVERSNYDSDFLDEDL